MWGITPYDNNAQINAYKAQYGITNPCAGTQGGGVAAKDIVIAGQNFLGYPTYCVVCPDGTLYFDVCWPPTVSCFDPYFELCAQSTLSADFTANTTGICEGELVNFTDNSSGDITSWEWEFEGGDPATSTEENPSVTYNTSGSFDVQLTVSDGTESDFLLIEDYISVNEYPEVTLQPFDDVCIYYDPFELTGGDPAGGEYSGPGVSNGMFDPEDAGLGTHDITYTYANGNDCESFALETIYVDPCTGIFENSGTDVLNIYPNPSSGSFNIEFRHPGNLSIKVVDVLGVTVFEEHGISENGDLKKTINIKNTENGIYFVIVQTKEETFVKKLKILSR